MKILKQTSILIALLTPCTISYGVLDKIGVSLISHAQNERVFFEMDDPSGAVLFARGNTWIIAFNVKDKFDLVSFSSSQILSNIEFVASDFAVLKFDIKNGYHPKISKYNKGWVLDLEIADMSIKKPIQLITKESGYALKTEGILDKIIFKDPISGENLIAFPTKNAEESLLENHDYLEFSLLATRQGIVIKPNIDNLKITRPHPDDIFIEVSSNSISSKEDESLYAKNPEFMALQFIEKTLKEQSFYEQKSEFMNKIASSPEQDLVQNRLNFAEFLISYALGSEAFDYLKDLRASTPKVDEQTKFMMLYGIAGLLCDELEIATEYFGKNDLKESGDAPFYLNLAKALQKKSFNEPSLKEFFRLFPHMPYDLKIKLGIKTIEATINNRLFKLAQDVVTLLLKEDVKNEDLDFIMYYQAFLYEYTGLFEAAEKTFKTLETSKYAKIKALTKMRVILKDCITPEKRDQAIKDLEILRSSVTNSPIEITIFEKLAELHMGNKRWVPALRTWNKILRYYPKFSKKETIKNKMRDLFTKQYRIKSMQNTEIFNILGLFDEFSFLIQDPDEQTKFVIELADFCIESSLNKKALSLLETRLNKTKVEAQKMTILIKIAQVQSRIGRDRDALKTINSINKELLNDELKRKFDYVKTYTLYILGEIDLKNQDILPQDNSYEAHNFRARVYWGLKDWQKAAHSLKHILELSESADRATQYHIIYYAIAVRYSGNFELLGKIRDYYLPQLKKSSFKTIFDVVTTLDTVMDRLNIPDLKDALNEIQTLENFVTEYKKNNMK